MHTLRTRQKPIPREAPHKDALPAHSARQAEANLLSPTGDRIVLNTKKIHNVITFGSAVYEAAQQILQGHANNAASCLTTITLLETSLQSLAHDGIRPPDPAYATLALLALREVGEHGGTLHIPADWTATLHRIAAYAGDCAVQQVLSTLCFIEHRYPGVLVWNGQN